MTNSDQNEPRRIGVHIEKLQSLMQEPVVPPTDWVADWQVQAEHVVAMAHLAKDRQDIDGLEMLDEEAARLIVERTIKNASEAGGA